MLSFIDLTQAETVKGANTDNPGNSVVSGAFYNHLIIGVYMMYLLVQLYKHDIKIYLSPFLKLITLSIIYWTLTYEKTSQSIIYDAIIFLTTFVLVHQSLPSSQLPVLNKAVIITGKRTLSLFFFFF